VHGDHGRVAQRRCLEGEFQRPAGLVQIADTDHYLPTRREIVVADHDDRAAGAGGHVLADRAEEPGGQRPGTPGPDDQHGGVRGALHQDLRGMAGQPPGVNGQARLLRGRPLRRAAQRACMVGGHPRGQLGDAHDTQRQAAGRGLPRRPVNGPQGRLRAIRPHDDRQACHVRLLAGPSG
jgi:hypothetical protein